MTAAWNKWYHCISSTYGSWLHGDGRGFRTRHHREHVIGDYKDPPPPQRYADRARASQLRMRADTVSLTHQDRLLVCLKVAETLVAYGTEIVDMCVGEHHMHLLARFAEVLPPRIDGSAVRLPRNLLADGREPIPRHVLGRANRAASIAMGKAGRKAEGTPLWAKRPKVLPIANRAHQIEVVRYIREHAREGAVIWSKLVKGA